MVVERHNLGMRSCTARAVPRVALETGKLSVQGYCSYAGCPVYAFQPQC